MSAAPIKLYIFRPYGKDWPECPTAPRRAQGRLNALILPSQIVAVVERATQMHSYEEKWLDIELACGMTLQIDRNDFHSLPQEWQPPRETPR